MKYIYFEIHMVSNGSRWVGEPEIKNENILVLEPHTNSDGNWGFRHWTNRYGPPGKDGIAPVKDMLVVDQNWINLDKFSLDTDGKPDSYKVLAEYVEKVLEKLNNLTQNKDE